MTGWIISPNGIHITGDFQTIAGFSGGDWQSNTTPMTQVDTTPVYTIIVNIPAFAKYEYKIVNGDQSYEVEFVPVESRVGYLFNDNRWLYVDSLADDTTFVGAILFAGNAPAGLTLVRYLVDMQNLSVSTSGVHVAGDFQGWDPAQTYLYSFVPGIYEIISYVTTGTYNYKFYNGNTSGTSETVPLACSVNGNREIAVTADTVLEAICFDGCVLCSLTGVEDIQNIAPNTLSPNPAQISSILTFNDNVTQHHVLIIDITGRIVRSYDIYNDNILELKKGNLNTGIYFVNSIDANNNSRKAKLIFE